MISKKEEIKLYRAIYELTFEREADFFYTNSVNVIFDFLRENFWGESLTIRVSLLCKLLDFDAEAHPKLKNNLRQKSKDLRLLFTDLHRDADLPS